MADDPIVLDTNGGWCWFQGPRVAVDSATGVVVITTVATAMGVDGEQRNGDIDVTSFDPRSGGVTTVTLATIPTGGLGDDHNVAAIRQRPDGRYLVMYTGHNYGLGGNRNSRGVDTCPDTFYRLSTHPHDATSWGEEQVFHWPSNDPVGDGRNAVTYSNLHHLADEGGGRGLLYNIARAAGQVWQIATSDDWGEHWTWRSCLSLPPAGGRAYSNGYMKFADNGRDRIDFLITEAHPRDFNNGIYHGYIQNGMTHATDGRVVDGQTFGDGAPTPESFTPVFSPRNVAAESLHTAWAVDLVRTDNQHLVGLFQCRHGTAVGPLHVTRPQPGTADHRLFVARLVDGQWHSQELAAMGAGLLDSEEDYTGLGCIDPGNGRSICIATPIDPRDGSRLAHHELFLGRDASGQGAGDWRWSAITADSEHDNLRPQLVPLADGRRLLLWLQGSYLHQTRYRTAVLARILDH